METLKKAAKELIHKTFQMQWKDHLQSLVMQGEYSCILESKSSDISWKAAIFNLPRGTLKFMLNSQLNTLPTKDNLTRWGKRLAKACTLCGRAEYLSHALSSCPYMLEQGRYTWRHDSVLSSIETFIKNEINSTDIDIISDLRQQSWNIPPDIILTSQRPDFVIVNRNQKSIYILELTVPYERNITMEHKYKSEKYAGLIGDLQDIGWSTSYHTFEVGCRGMITKENAQT